MASENEILEQLSPWWRRAVVITMLIGFTVLILIAVLAYRDAPPIPDKVVSVSWETLLTGRDIMAGQGVFLNCAGRRPAGDRGGTDLHRSMGNTGYWNRVHGRIAETRMG